MSQYKYFATVFDRMMDNIPYEEWKQYILQLFFKYGVKPCARIAEFDLKTEHFYENELDGKTFSEDMRDFSYIWRNEYSAVDHIHRYYLEFHVDGKVIREIHRQRAFGATDIKKAALTAGFTKATAYDAFTFTKPRRTSHRIYIVMRNV